MFGTNNFESRCQHQTGITGQVIHNGAHLTIDLLWPALLKLRADSESLTSTPIATQPGTHQSRTKEGPLHLISAVSAGSHVL